MRTYERTHPWINFTLDLRKASFKLFLMLGEAQSKCQHIIGIPLMPRVAEEFNKIYLAKGAMATTAIEGNTLTENEVLERIDGKRTLPPSREYLGQEIDNIIEAYKYIQKRMLNEKITEITVEDIRAYNKIVLKNLPLNNEITPGEIRSHKVGVGNYLGAPPEDCEYLLMKLCEWLNAENEFPKEYKIVFGIIKAIFTHLNIAWIHPFGDGNGRTARLMELQILLSVGIPATTVHLLSNHYNQTRAEYYRQLEVSHKSKDGIFSFMEYALQGFIDGLKEQIDLVKLQQLSVHWTNYIHDMFRDKNSPADVRQRRLVLDLSKDEKPVPISKINRISARIAEAYANKTYKTVTRDINALITMGLVEKKGKEIRAKKEIIQAFLPQTINES